MKARGFVIWRESGEPAAGVTVVAKAARDGAPATVGVLTSDAVGYVSFDLRALAGPSPERVWLEVPGSTDKVVLVDGEEPRARAEGTRGTDGPFVLEVDPATAGRDGQARPSMPSVQSPDELDWELSPYSFVAPREMTVGSGACAVPVPSPEPVQVARFYQVVRNPVSEVSRFVLDPLELGTDGGSSEGLPTPRLCGVVEVEQEWHDLGHSLGTILYSLPLAPCESVDLAVIEAARADAVSRADAVLSEESLLHDLRRDRSIEETVKTTLRESQGGWSVAGGVGGVVGPVVGNLGAAVTRSWGERNLTGRAVQELHDRTVQASSAVRSLSSTVVVQATQTESHRLETRTVTNHNHCHALTVQYYEVLRRMKLVTRHAGSRPGLLVPYRHLRFRRPFPGADAPASGAGDVRVGEGVGGAGVGGGTGPFPRPPIVRTLALDPTDLRLVNRLRPLLESSLLRPELAPNFEAIRRLLYFGAARLPSPPSSPAPADYPIDRITFRLKRGRYSTAGGYDAPINPLAVALRLRLSGNRFAPFAGQPSRGVPPRPDQKPPEYWPVVEGGLGGPDRGEDAPLEWLPEQSVDLATPVKRSELDEVQVHWSPPFGDATPDWSFRGIEVRTTSPGGEETLVREESDDLGGSGPFQDFRTTPSVRSFRVPRPTANPPEPPKEGDRQTGGPTEEQDVALAWELIGHLHDHRGFYSQRLVASKPLDWFLPALEEALGANDGIIDDIDPLPVAVSGPYLVFLLPGRADLEPNGDAEEPKVDYPTFPTRGLLAEAQLGGCNSCETRDVTRFWRWEESPCAEEPPEIGGVTPGFRGQPPDVQPSTLPSPVVQITQPPNAPDPVGLAAALNLLGQPNVFRDMSGLAQVSNLLEGLTSGAISLAQARAMAEKAKETLAQGGGSVPGATTFEPDAAKQIDRLKAIETAKDAGLIDGEQASNAAEGVLGSGGDKQTALEDVAGKVRIDLAKYCTPRIRAFKPGDYLAGTPADKSGKTALRAVVTNAPGGSTWRWSVSDGTKARIVSPSAHITDVLAGHPGLVDLTFEARDSGGKTLATSSSRLCVPQFVAIYQEAAAFDGQLAAYHLRDVKSALLQRVKSVVDFLLLKANVRTVWTIAPFNEVLPPQFSAGEFAAGKYNRLTIRGKNMADPGLAGRVPGAGAGAAKPDETIDIWPGAFDTPGTDVGVEVANIVGKVSALNMTDPQLKSIWIEIMGRLIGETVAHEIHHALLAFAIPGGHNSPSIPWDLMNRGTERSFLQRTGIEILDRIKFPQPSSYRDGGIQAISGVLRDNQARVDSVFPVPPAFQ